MIKQLAILALVATVIWLLTGCSAYSVRGTVSFTEGNETISGTVELQPRKGFKK